MNPILILGAKESFYYFFLFIGKQELSQTPGFELIVVS